MTFFVIHYILRMNVTHLDYQSSHDPPRHALASRSPPQSTQPGGRISGHWSIEIPRSVASTTPREQLQLQWTSGAPPRPHAVRAPYEPRVGSPLRTGAGRRPTSPLEALALGAGGTDSTDDGHRASPRSLLCASSSSTCSRTCTRTCTERSEAACNIPGSQKRGGRAAPLE